MLRQVAAHATLNRHLARDALARAVPIATVVAVLGGGGGGGAGGLVEMETEMLDARTMLERCDGRSKYHG